MLRLVVALAACHLAKSDNSCALDDSCALDETALLQMKPMRSLEEIDQGDQEGQSETDESERLHRRRRGKKFGAAIKSAVNKGKDLYDKGKAVVESDLGQAAIKAAKAHSKKALALLEEVDEEDEEEEGEVVDSESEEADEESEAEGEEDLERLHRRRRGKKFGAAIKSAVNKGKDLYEKGKAVVESDLGQAAIKAAKAHSKKALALLEEVEVAEDDDQDLELSDDDLDGEEDMERLHRRRRGKKFGHGLKKVAKVAKKTYDVGKKVYDHPAGKVAITAAMAAR